MNYLVVAYKPSSEDTCRGCLMASYGDDFVIETYNYDPDYPTKDELLKERAIQKIANILAKNEFLDGAESPYEIHAFIDGVDSTDEFIKEAQPLAGKLIEDKKLQIQQKVDALNLKLRLEQEEREKKQLEALKIKYPSGS